MKTKATLFTSLFASLFVLCVLSPVFAKPAPKRVVVPTDQPTIQEALAVADDKVLIILEPGVYDGPIYISGKGRDVTIKAKKAGTVILTTRLAEPVISVVVEAVLTLEGLTVRRSAGLENYRSSAIFAEFGSTLVVTNCTVLSNAYGIIGNYTRYMKISDSLIIGMSPSSNGIGAFHQNPLGPGLGSYITGNLFLGLKVAVDASSSWYDPWIENNEYKEVETILVTR
jgi:nitrous oxidase accessory protein NosD